MLLMMVMILMQLMAQATDEEEIQQRRKKHRLIFHVAYRQISSFVPRGPHPLIPYDSFSRFGFCSLLRLPFPFPLPLTFLLLLLLVCLFPSLPPLEWVPSTIRIGIVLHPIPKSFDLS